MLVVLPFEMVGAAADQEFFGDGITEIPRQKQNKDKVDKNNRLFAFIKLS